MIDSVIMDALRSMVKNEDAFKSLGENCINLRAKLDLEILDSNDPNLLEFYKSSMTIEQFELEQEMRQKLKEEGGAIVTLKITAD